MSQTKNIPRIVRGMFFVLLSIAALVLFVALVSREDTSVEKGAKDEAPYFNFNPQASISIRGAIFKVEIADTSSERKQGLSGRSALPAKGGMLFVFNSPDIYGIWMKDMNFPIDILWLGDDLRVIHGVFGASPSSYPLVFKPQGKARYVLEVRAGDLVPLEIQNGDQAILESL